MARPLRIGFPEAVYDVTSRGNVSRPILRESGFVERVLPKAQGHISEFMTSKLVSNTLHGII